MNSFELSWKSKDGLDLFGRAWEPAERKPKAVICHVHGLGEHSGRYVHVAQAFTKAGYAMLSFDLRGHGRSGGERGHILSIDDYMQDIDSLFEQARARYSGLPMFLYGHSIGAVQVLGYCLRRKPNLKGVITTGPSLHTAVEYQIIKVIMAKALGALFPTVTIPSGLKPGDLSRDQAVVQAYINDPLVHDKVSLGFGRSMLEANRYALDHAAEFSLPLLLIHGKEDKIAFPSSSIEFAAPLKDKCTLLLWDGLYHEVHNEPEKAEVLDAMTIWMDARLA
jgi:alpha-beta hydrolase superfamily lysophospholipase